MKKIAIVLVLLIVLSLQLFASIIPPNSTSSKDDFGAVPNNVSVPPNSSAGYVPFKQEKKNTFDIGVVVGTDFGAYLGVVLDGFDISTNIGCMFPNWSRSFAFFAMECEIGGVVYTYQKPDAIRSKLQITLDAGIGYYFADDFEMQVSVPLKVKYYFEKPIMLFARLSPGLGFLPEFMFTLEADVGVAFCINV